MIWSELPDSQEEWARRFADAAYLVQPGALRLREGMLQQDRPVVAIASEIVVDGEHSTGGHPVALVARRIVFLPGSCINANGPDDPGYPADVQPTNPQPGADGRPGHRGGDAPAAGWVWLSAIELEGEVRVRSDGGSGGAGENGENGARGQDGAFQGERGRPGNPGTNGGRGSLGGNGGDGGPGGHVVVAAPVAAEACVCELGGGRPGDAGKNGGPGSKGIGSEGGAAYSVFEGGGGANPRRP